MLTKEKFLGLFIGRYLGAGVAQEKKFSDLIKGKAVVLTIKGSVKENKEVGPLVGELSNLRKLRYIESLEVIYVP